MSDYRYWLDKGGKSSERMVELLPILIRQAQLERPVTYGDIGDELGVHHRAVHHIAGFIGFTLAAVGERKGWKRRAPPPIHALIVNKDTRLPGSGIDGFLSSTYQMANSADERRAVLKAIYASAANYEHWDALCALLGVELDDANLANAVQKAKRSRGRGGEGPAHKALKNLVATTPELVGLPRGSTHGQTEWPTASGDKIDVVFNRRNRILAVEVKPHHAAESDKLRGVFQCLKYRVVLEAEMALSGERCSVVSILALGGAATEDVRSIANRLGIMIVENLDPE